MKIKNIILMSLVSFSLLGCGADDSTFIQDTDTNTRGTDKPVDNNLSIDDNNTDSLISEKFNSGDITSITPSIQTSDEVISLVKNTSSLPYETIDPNIKLSIGYGGIKQGVDADGKRVFLMATHRKNFQQNNMFFCHESDLTCTKLVDNSGDQHIGSVGVFYDGKIWINTLDKTVDSDGGLFGSALNYYDVNTKEYKKRVIDMTGLNGETRTMSLGTDKKLYFGGTNFGSVPHYASVAYVDPKNLNDYKRYTNYFTQAPVDRSRSIAADDEYIYQVVGDNPYYLLAINKANGTAVKINETTDGKVIQYEHGVIFQYTKNGTRTSRYLYKGAIGEEGASYPWSAGQTPNHQGSYWAEKGNYFLEYNTSGYLKAKYNRQNMPTTTAGINGVKPFEFVASVEDRNISFSISDIDLYKQDVNRITTLNDGNLLIRGAAYSGISLLNTLNDTATYIGSTGFSPSVMQEFYDYSKSKIQVMFEGYPSTAAMIYDPSGYMNSSNTEGLGYLRAVKDVNCKVDCENKDIDTHRALEMRQIGKSLYFSGMQYRSGISGGIIIYNTLTKEKKAISKGIFDNYQTRSLLVINDKLVIGTQAVDNREFGGKARPSTPKIFVMDPESLKIIKEYTPLKGLNALDIGRIESIDGRHIIGISNNQYANGSSLATKTFIYIIDTYTDNIVMQKTINMKNNMLITPEGSARNRGYGFIKHNNFIYAYIDSRTLIKIDGNGYITPVVLMPVQSRLTFVKDDAYFVQGTNVLKMNIP